MKKILVNTSITELLDEVNILFEKGWDIVISPDGAMVYSDGPHRMCLLELGIHSKLDKHIVHGESLIAAVNEVNEYLEQSYDLVDLGAGQYLASLKNITGYDYSLIIVHKPEDGI